MKCLSPERVIELQEELAVNKVLKAALVAGMTAAANKGVESFTLDTGVSKQSVKNYSLKEGMEEIRILTAEISRINRILNGTGISSVRVRRY